MVRVCQFRLCWSWGTTTEWVTIEGVQTTIDVEPGSQGALIEFRYIEEGAA